MRARNDMHADEFTFDRLDRLCARVRGRFHRGDVADHDRGDERVADLRHRAGEFDIRGPNNSQMLLSFVLPVAMTGPSGALMPLSSGAGDAGYSQSQSIGSQVGFDPRQSFTATLSNNGRGSVFVGGRANPATNQRAGAYTATLTLNVTVLP